MTAHEPAAQQPRRDLPRARGRGRGRPHAHRGGDGLRGDARGRPALDELRAEIEHRLALLPRYRSQLTGTARRPAATAGVGAGPGFAIERARPPRGAPGAGRRGGAHGLVRRVLVDAAGPVAAAVGGRAARGPRGRAVGARDEDSPRARGRRRSRRRGAAAAGRLSRRLAPAHAGPPAADARRRPSATARGAPRRARSEDGVRLARPSGRACSARRRRPPS